jgi:hypothetical protein
MVSGTAHSSGARQGRGVSRSPARAADVAGRHVTGLSREVLAELVAEGARAGTRDWPIGRASARSAPAPGIGRCSSTGCWPPWCICAMESLITCWPADPECPARRSPERSAKCARCWPSVAAPSKAGGGCAPWPTSSPTWVPAGSSAYSMPPRCGCATQPRGGPVGAGSSRARRRQHGQAAGHHRCREAAAVLRADAPGLP